MLSPLVATREFYFLRYCQQIEPSLWAVVDVSYDFPRDNQFSSPCQCHRLPSGCLIRDVPNGYSEVSQLNSVSVTVFWSHNVYFLCKTYKFTLILVQTRLHG